MASARTHPARAALLLFATVIVLVAGVKLIPGLLRAPTATTSTPVRRELNGDFLLALAATQRECLGAVPFDRDGSLVQVAVRQVHAPGAELRLTATAPGYRAGAQIRLAPRPVTTYKPEVSIPLRPPSGATIGTLCAENAGPGTVELIGSADPRALTRTTATLNGVRQPAAFSVRLLDGRHRSTAARTPDIVDHAAALSPFGPWLFWLLIPLLALGLPLLVGAALASALREPKPPTRHDAH